jgi:hypothetical protein
MSNFIVDCKNNTCTLVVVTLNNHGPNKAFLVDVEWMVRNSNSISAAVTP